MSEATPTLAQILFKLSAFLPPEDAREIARQMEEHFPADLLPSMSAGLDMALLAARHTDSEYPRLFMGGGNGVREERDGLRGCIEEGSARRSMAARMELLQEIYPLRAAALYLRVLLNILAGLLERGGPASVSDEMMLLLIDGLRRAEAVIDSRCMNCPRIEPAS